MRAGGALAGVDGEALTAAVGRLESLFPREFRTVLRALDDASVERSDRTILLSTLQLMVGRRQTWLRYAAASNGGAVTERVVDPYAVIPYGKSWHLVGHCHLRAEVRLSKIDRIRQLRPLDGRFPPPDFDLTAFVTQGWGLMPGIAGPVEEVMLRFQPPTAQFVTEESWHSSQRVTWDAADGTALFRVTVTITPELRRWVFGYGSAVEVIAPDHLRAWVADEARRVVALARVEGGV